MGNLLKISTAIDAFNTRIGSIIKWFILAAVLVATTNAIIRKVFNVSSNSWLELQWYLFGAVFMLGAAYTFLMNEHIRIDVVTGNFRKRTRDRIDVFGHIFFLIPFCAIMIYHGWPFFMRSYALSGATANHAWFAIGLVLLLGAVTSLWHFWWNAKAQQEKYREVVPLVIAISLILIMWQSERVIVLADTIKNGWETSMNAGGLTVWPAKLLVPAGFVLLLAQAFSELIKRIAIIRGEMVDPHVHVGHLGAAEAEAERLLKVAAELELKNRS